MKKYKPTTPGRRGMTGISYREVLTASEPHKALTKGVNRSVGRNSAGRITTRHKGAGHKRVWRDVSFRYDKREVEGTVKTVEYDPNRSGFIALVSYKDGEKRYVLLPQSVKVGDTIVASENAQVKAGNSLPLSKIPVGTFVYNVELKPGGGAKIARSAGNYAEVIANDAGFTHLKMPSSEVRKVSEKAWGSVGEVSNEEHRLVNIGKAGRSRWMGRRPTVRGSAMNPVDHPYGGGEGRAGRGRRRAVSKWGKPTGIGQKTRRAKKYSNTLIVKRRKVGKKR
ncbi:MAG: 50S ribosomal protein L2 [Candidatus Paceibacteria bacterium]